MEQKTELKIGNKGSQYIPAAKAGTPAPKPQKQKGDDLRAGGKKG